MQTSHLARSVNGQRKVDSPFPTLAKIKGGHFMTSKKTTKRALLMSALSLLLCVSMLIGTTYAWFTDSVTSAGNKIVAGNLEVDLLMYNGTDYRSIAEDTNPIFGEGIIWEPGRTQVAYLAIENTGSLALKYTVGLHAQNVAKDLYKVMKYAVSEGVEAETLTAWDAANAKAVAVGAQTISGPISLGAGETHYFALSIHMDENAGNEYQNGKVFFDLSVLATQDTVEADSFGNQYDADAEYPAAPTPAPIITNAAQLKEAIENAAAGDVLTLSAGNYDFISENLVIDKPITLIGEELGSSTFSANSEKTVLQVVTSDGTPGGGIIHGIEIRSDNVTLKNLVIAADPSKTNSGNLIQISPNGTEYYSDILIDNCQLIGSDHSIALYGNNVTIQNCILDESTAPDQGNIIYVWGTSGTLTIQNNHFIGKAQKKHGISFYNQSAASAVSGEIIIEGNLFDDVYKAIVHESSMTYDNVSVSVLNNVFNCKKKPVAIDKGTFVSYVVNGNIFGTIAELPSLIDNKVGAAVNADGNYWGTETPDLATLAPGVTVNSYYTDAEKTNLVQIGA